MRQFARPMSLDSLSLEARVLYSSFCVFLLLGALSSVWLWHDDDIGLSPAAAARHYLGDAPAVIDESPSGPALELPPTGELAIKKDARQVMEVFHFHLFTVPVCLLIVGHLFMMTSWPTRRKAWIIALASLATLLHVLGPLLIRFVHATLGVVFVVTALIMSALWTLMLVLPLIDMWKRDERV